MKLELNREDFINQYPPLNFLVKEEVEKLWEKKKLNLYVHIPFCVRKCDFCYYKTIPIGNQAIPDEYVEALKREIEIYSELPEIKGRKVESLYFGGGTPTLLSEKQLESIITLIHKRFEFEEDHELCCEARPSEETSYSKIQLLNSLGLKRLSLGCQSLDKDVLAINGRNHKVEDFYKVYDLAREAKVFSINVDIMSGLVNETEESWKNTINKVIELSPENIAIYKMEVYLNNRLYLKLRDGSISLMSDEKEAELAKWAYRELMEKGYILANNYSFTKAKKYDHVHRRQIMRGHDMLGVGLSAHSCLNGFNYQNETRMPQYVSSLKEGRLPIYRAHKISKREEMIQRVIFGIKNVSFSRTEFYNEFGIDVMDVFGKELKFLEESGFINIKPGNIDTTFEGIIYADDIVRVLYLPEHKNVVLAHANRPRD